MVKGEQEESVLYEAHPAMFRNRPVVFSLCVLTIPLVVGLVGLVVWFLNSRSTTLTVTDRWTRLRRGLLSRDISTVVLARSYSRNSALMSVEAQMAVSGSISSRMSRARRSCEGLA